MIGANDGPAFVMVYADGVREAVLLHRHDGGIPYMLPLLRRGIGYAKTHYDCGNIVDVLLSEHDMSTVGSSEVVATAEKERVRHLYYLAYRWDPEACTKTYVLSGFHLKEPEYATSKETPEMLRDIPKRAVRVM